MLSVVTVIGWRIRTVIEVPAGRHVVRFEFKPVEGAVKEIMARLTGKPIEPTPPAWEPWLKPEASAPAFLRGAG